MTFPTGVTIPLLKDVKAQLFLENSGKLSDNIADAKKSFRNTVLGEGEAGEPADAILVTHAHIDHTGALPLVASRFPEIPIYATESTIALMRLLLLDSVRIMEAEHLQPDGETPLYSEVMVEALLERIVPIDFGQPFHPLPHNPTLTVRYIRAGHILGAGMLLLETPEGRILHTGTSLSPTSARSVVWS